VPEDKTNTPTLKLSLISQLAELQKQAILKKIAQENSSSPPGILINSWPHSGSTFIVKKLSEITKLPSLTVHAGFNFLDLVLDWPKARKLLWGQAVGISHVACTKINRVICRQALEKIVIHIRDPRQATLSRVHKFHTKLKAGHFGWVERKEPPVPEDYFTLSFENQIWWQIRNHLPILIKWLDTWLEAESDPGFNLNLLFTSHEELSSDPHALFQKIARFYSFSLPKDMLFERPAKPDMQLNYRKGLVDEWRTVFSGEQKAASLEMIPEHMARRFNWSLD
jgi:hypothetical protein